MVFKKREAIFVLSKPRAEVSSVHVRLVSYRDYVG